MTRYCVAAAECGMIQQHTTPISILYYSLLPPPGGNVFELVCPLANFLWMKAKKRKCTFDLILPMNNNNYYKLIMY